MAGTPRLRLHPSCHIDTFTRDNLPDPASWPEFRFELPELRYPPLINCADSLLDRHVREGKGKRRCLLTPDEEWTYSDLLSHANQVARVLVEELDIKPGSRILLRAPNNPWLVACWFAVLKVGGVAVCTMPLLRSGELRTIAEVAKVSLCLCDARYVDDLVAAQIPSMRIVQFGAGVTGDLADLAAKKSTDFENIRTASDDVCMLAFTSGTTGQPKATMHFHRDVLAIVDTYARHVLKPSPGDLFAGSPPLAFTFGLGGLVVFPLAAGAATLLLDRASPQQLLEAVGHHGVTTLFTAPTAYRAMLPHLKEVDIGTLHTCVSAGESLPAATWQAFRDGSGIEIMDGIGSTEMLHIFISAAGNKIRPGATGQVVPGYVAEVQDASGSPVADGELGRLAVKGPTGCRYLGGDRQNAYVQAGWNLTGDTFVRDADGYFWFQARADDMIISSGYNIAGPEVENALLQHPDVAEVVVVGFPDPARGTIVKAFVVPKPGVARTDQTIKTLQDFVKAQIAPYKYPRAITFVDSLPRTSTGKVQRFQLRRGGP